MHIYIILSINICIILLIHVSNIYMYRNPYLLLSIYVFLSHINPFPLLLYTPLIIHRQPSLDTTPVIYPNPV